MADPEKQPIILKNDKDDESQVVGSPSDRLLVSVGVDGKLYLRYLDDLTKSSVFLNTDDDTLRMIAFSPNGRWIAGGMSAGSVLVWDTDHLEKTNVRLKGSSDSGEVSALTFSRNELSLMASFDDKSVAIWATADYFQAPKIYSGNIDIGT